MIQIQIEAPTQDVLHTRRIGSQDDISGKKIPWNKVHCGSFAAEGCNSRWQQTATPANLISLRNDQDGGRTVQFQAGPEKVSVSTQIYMHCRDQVKFLTSESKTTSAKFKVMCVVCRGMLWHVPTIV